MPAAYSMELRERVAALFEEGFEPLEISRTMKLGVATVGRWKRALRERGSVAPLPLPGGGDEKLGIEGKEFLLNLVQQSADATLAEMVDALQDHLGIDVTDSTVSAVLVKHGYTWKKKVTVQPRPLATPPERGPEPRRRAGARRAWPRGGLERAG